MKKIVRNESKRKNMGGDGWVGGRAIEKERKIFSFFSMTDKVIKKIVMTIKTFMHQLFSFIISKKIIFSRNQRTQECKKTDWKNGRIPFSPSLWAASENFWSFTLTIFKKIHHKPCHKWQPIASIDHDWETSAQLSTKLFYSKQENYFFPSLKFSTNFSLFLLTVQCCMVHDSVCFWVLFILSKQSNVRIM